MPVFQVVLDAEAGVREREATRRQRTSVGCRPASPMQHHRGRSPLIWLGATQTQSSLQSRRQEATISTIKHGGQPRGCRRTRDRGAIWLQRMMSFSVCPRTWRKRASFGRRATLLWQTSIRRHTVVTGLQVHVGTRGVALRATGCGTARRALQPCRISILRTRWW